MAQALVELGRLKDARKKLQEVYAFAYTVPSPASRSPSPLSGPSTEPSLWAIDGAHFFAGTALAVLVLVWCCSACGQVLRVSKNNKNADASKLLAELEGKEDFTPAKQTADTKRGAGAAAARRAIIREDRAQRLTVEEVNSALISRCGQLLSIALRSARR